MSRTIVIFHLPENQLVYLELEDLVALPVEGNFVVLEGVRYRVGDVIESIGEFKSDGSQTRREGLAKLLEILAVMFDKEAMSLFRGLRNIGSGDQVEKIGAIVMPNKSIVGDFDRPVVVRLKAVGGKAPVTDLLGQLLRTFVSTDAPTAARDVVGIHGAPGVPPIIVGVEAAE